jgi:hypothetical protein
VTRHFHTSTAYVALCIHLSQLNHTACVTSGFLKYCSWALYTHMAFYSLGSLVTSTVRCSRNIHGKLSPVSPRRQVIRCFHPVRLISLVLACTTQVSSLRRYTYTRYNIPYAPYGLSLSIALGTYTAVCPRCSIRLCFVRILWSCALTLVPSVLSNI